MASFQAARTQLLDQVEAALQKQFAEFSYPNVVLSTRIAHIQTWPKSWEQLKDYGDADLKVLLDHFDNIITHGEDDSAEAEVEWTLLKKNMYDDYIAKQLNPDWKDVNDRYGDSLKNILTIIDLILTMSPSSAEAERGFSQMKLIKTSIRSRLSQKSLNQCLAIRLLSEDISNFDPTPAINYWNESGSRSRRPEFKRQASSLTERNLTDDADKVIVPETFDNTSEVENEASFELWHSHSYYEKDFGEESDFDDGEDEASVFAQLMEDYRSS